MMAQEQKAEGCFNVKIGKRSNTVTGFSVMLRFILDHKNSQYLLLKPLLVYTTRRGKSYEIYFLMEQ
jgi:hypothetical protein